MEEMPEPPSKEPFRRDQDFDPHFARFIVEVVRSFKVSMDQIPGKINGRYRSETFSDPSHQQSTDAFRGKINRNNKPEGQ